MNSQPSLSQVLVRTKGNGEVTYYVYGLGLIGEQSAGNYFSYLFDYRGSTVAITDTTGQVIDTVQYSPFGVVLSQPTFDTPFLFNGLYSVMTDDNGLSYMRARYYSAEIRRFVNQDVLLGNVADGQSLNRFVFVTGNPVSFVDPEGLSAQYIPCLTLIAADGPAPFGDTASSLVYNVRPKNMSILEERQYDQYCKDQEDPCLVLKAKIAELIANSRDKILDMKLDRFSIFGKEGWINHIRPDNL